MPYKKLVEVDAISSRSYYRLLGSLRKAVIIRRPYEFLIPHLASHFSCQNSPVTTALFLFRDDEA